MQIKLNLLPEEKKREIRRGKRLRFFVWQGFLAFLLMVFFGGVLFGIYSMLSLNLNNLRQDGEAESREPIFQEISSAEQVFQNTNSVVGELKKLQREHIVWTKFFDEINGILSEKIVIEKIATNNYTVSLSGVAETRDDLLRLQAKLNESHCFRNASLPLSDLFSQKNTEFQLDVEIKKDCLKPGNI